MGEELLDRVAFLWVDGEEVGDEVLGRFGDVVPPGGEEGVLTPGDLLGEDLDAFVVEGGETAEEGVEDAAEGPHVHAFGVPLVFYNLGCCVPDCTAWGHGLTVPDYFGETEIGNLDLSYSSRSDTLDVLSLIGFVFIFRSSWLGIPRRDERYGIE